MTKIKLVVFDLDGTLLVPTSSWKYLHEALDTWKAAEKNSNLYHNKKISWEEWAKKDAQLWKGIPIEKIKEIAKSAPLTKGIHKTMHQLREHDIEIAIISGGVSYFAEMVAEEFNIKYVYSIILHSKNGKLNGEISINVTDTNKGELLNSLLKELDLEKENVVAVGDDFTMISQFENSGISIAFNSSLDKIKEKADHIINTDNLCDILPCILKENFI